MRHLLSTWLQLAIRKTFWKVILYVLTKFSCEREHSPREDANSRQAEGDSQIHILPGRQYDELDIRFVGPSDDPTSRRVVYMSLPQAHRTRNWTPPSPIAGRRAVPTTKDLTNVTDEGVLMGNERLPDINEESVVGEDEQVAPEESVSMRNERAPEIKKESVAGKDERVAKKRLWKRFWKKLRGIKGIRKGKERETMLHQSNLSESRLVVQEQSNQKVEGWLQTDAAPAEPISPRVGGSEAE